MRKRLFSILLVFILACIFMPIPTVRVQAAGLSLQQLKDKFPQDAYWNGGNVDSYTWSPCASHSNCDYYGGCSCNSFSNAIQCHGFALKLGYDAFGTNPRNWSRASNPYDYVYSLKPGDIVTSDSPYHTFFVIGVTSSSVTIGECNWGGRCRINWGRSINKSTIAGYSALAIYIAPTTLNTGIHSHSYASSVTTNPTCTSAGVRTYRCSCGNSFTESIAALGHDYTGDRLYEPAHPHQISQRCVRYSSCGGFYWTGENYFVSNCSTCLSENQKQIHSSHNSASLYLGGADSQTIYFWSSGYYNGNCSYRWERSNQNISPSWGDWTEDNRLPLTITAKSIGTTALTISIIDSDTEAVLDSMTINVTVDVYASSLSKNTSNSATISTAGKMKYYTYTPSTSGTYVIYSTVSDDTKVYLYNANGTELSSDDDGGDNRNFRLEYNLTAGTKYIFGVKYYGSSTTGTISFKFGNVYTINYNANGGTGAPSSQTKDYGMSITLSSTKPTRTGYTFLGWSTSSTATSATYQLGATYSSNANITLYAVWKANTYTVSYNANGGTGAPGNQTKTYGVNLTLSSTKPTLIGYTFLGWSTSSSATSATYQPGGSFTSNANTTLYAVWKKGCESNNHNYTTNVTPPTCTEKGYTKHTCSLCGDTYIDTYTNIAKHDYANGKCTHCGAADPNYVIDQNAAQMTIDSVTATCGQTVTINITAKNMSQVKTLLIDSFEYNKNVLEFVSGTLKVNNAAISDWSDKEMIASVAFSSNTNINGVVLTLTFKVKDGADGEYSISCEAYAQKVQNGREEAITVSVVSGKINVTKQIRGDMDANNIVNSDDAIHLLRHTLFADRYLINQSGDMNRDGVVNSDDAIHLLRHTLFADKYPL